MDSVTLEADRISTILSDFNLVRAELQATFAEIRAKMEAIPELNAKVESLFEGTKEFALKSEASVSENETKLKTFTRRPESSRRRSLLTWTRPRPQP